MFAFCWQAWGSSELHAFILGSVGWDEPQSFLLHWLETTE
jgi:hypothetical protein